MPNNKYDIPDFQTLTELADFIEALPDNDDKDAKIGFDMKLGMDGKDYTDHPCGTACCIGGFAMLADIAHNGAYTASPKYAVKNRFCVSESDARDICYPPNYIVDVEQVLHPGWSASPQQGAELLRHYIATGEVDWDRAMKYSSTESMRIEKETADA